MFKLLKLKFIISALVVASIFFVVISPVIAADSLTLSITPPIFQLTIGPGEFLESNLKIVNINSYDLTLYASVMDFEANDEEGHGNFIPSTEIDPESSGYSLSHWITVPKNPILVQEEQSKEMPFSVRIPEDAPPGGYYAAILVGTQPPANQTEGSSIKVSSMVSSLLFVKIKGDVREEGRIREFFAEKSFYQTPEVDFTLRFENIGNVHLQPEGNITIYNMSGKKIDSIALQEENDFGNVLPQTTKKLNFKWEGEDDLFDIGQYKAVATLTYGENGRQNISAITYFWVVPIKLLFSVLGGCAFLILLIFLIVRAYMKKSLGNIQKEIESVKSKSKNIKKTKKKISSRK